LNIVTVQLPALRERPEDVVPLMDHFRKMFIKRHGKPQCSFARAVTKRFYSYEWPGNIRQLRNFVETMVVLDTDGTLDLDDLPPELAQEGDIGSGDTSATESSGAALPGSGDSSLLGRSMAEIERWAIEETLKMTAGNREEAAKILSIGSRTLYRKLDKYRQDDGDEVADAPEESATESAESSD
ncbi:MAG: helix-turn-helix domain-containing protein, partial [Planctomycetota bacterium]